MAANVQSVMSHGDVIDQFLSAMREQGIEVDEPLIADGRLHRYHVAGDRGRSRNAWAVLHIDDRPAGKFGCYKRHGSAEFSWQMKGVTPMTPEERDALRTLARERAKQRDAEMELLHREAADRALEIYNAGAPVTEHPYLTHKGVPSNEKLRVGKWYYFNEETERYVLVSSNALLVPLMDAAKRIHSLQAIIPEDDGDFSKWYLKNGVKAGKVFTIGAPKDNVILICEGLATGLSLWQCTGHAVVVAFDTGNLAAAGEMVMRVRPATRLIFCADNDAWTHTPVDNPGVTAARLAALKVNAQVAIPKFANVDSKPTDFNDLHQLQGERAVRDIIEALTSPTEETADRILSGDPPPSDPPPDLPRGTPPGPSDPPEVPENNRYFMILGYDHGIVYFYSHRLRQVIAYTVAQMNDGGFLYLAPLDWWEENYRTTNGSIDKKKAINFFVETAAMRGVYRSDNMRGRGAWFDDGRSVYHHGNRLTVDGQPVDVTRIRSKYIYEIAPELQAPADVPLSNQEGFNLLNIAHHFRWAMPGSAALLMGWITLAPLCGALKWRPHIWLSGNAGSGKSTILEMFITPLLGQTALYVQGNSTEAGLRGELQADARPVVYEESEQNEERDVTRVQAIIGLMRQCSSESQARTYKGTASGKSMDFHIRSMFCLASVQMGAKHQTDRDRISVLTLRNREQGDNASTQWETMKSVLIQTISEDPTIGRRLLRRSLDLLPVILKNVDVFKRAAAQVFKNQRTGDQYGTLLAGCFALIETREATMEDAMKLIDAYRWDDYVDQADTDEGKEALQGLLGAQVRSPGPGNVTLNIYEVLSAAMRIYRKGVDLDADLATALLARYGMMVQGDYLLLSNSSNELRALMAKTTFKADWRGVLLRVPGSDRNGNQPVRINGIMQKVIRVDLREIFKDEFRRQATVDIDDQPPPF